MNETNTRTYTTPTLSMLGSRCDAGPKGGASAEGNPGCGQGDVRRP